MGEWIQGLLLGVYISICNISLSKGTSSVDTGLPLVVEYSP